MLFGLEDTTLDLSFGFDPYAEVAGGMSYYHYNEPNVMDIFGPMYNLNVLLGAKLNPLLKTELEIYFSQDTGKNIYNGAIQITDMFGTKNEPFSARSNDYYAGGEYRAGFILGDGISVEYLTIYTGFGYRFLQNLVDSSAAYLRKQSYLYMPFGVKSNIPIARKVSLRLNAELMALLLGLNTSYFTDIQRDQNLHFTQKSGTGARVSLGFNIALDNKNSIFIQGYFNYWNIADSNSLPSTQNGKFVGNYIEPKNTTTDYGIQIGYHFN